MRPVELRCRATQETVVDKQQLDIFIYVQISRSNFSALVETLNLKPQTLKQYIASVYWGFTTITTVGYMIC